MLSADVHSVSEKNYERDCVVKPSRRKIYLEEDSDLEVISEEVEADYPHYEEYDEEKSEDYKVPLFDGTARMTARVRLPAKRFDIWAEVSAVCGKGTLLTAAGVRDYLWVGFNEDKTVMRWDAGSGTLELRSGKVRINGKSKLSARRYKKDAMLRVGTTTVRGSAQGRMSSLDVDPFIYIGSPPQNFTKLTGTSLLSGFIGCVHRLRVSGRDVIPPARGLPITSHGVRHCTPHNIAQIACP